MPQQSQFDWNKEKMEIFNKLMARVTKADLRAQSHQPEKIKRVERQIKTGNCPPQVKEFGVLVHIESPDGGPVGIIHTW